MRVKFSRLADAEVEEAHAWYAAREPALAEAFRVEIAEVVDLIAERPAVFAVVFARMRRAMLKRFPYFLLYEAFPDTVIVFGVIHGARDPRSWIRRGDR